MVYKNSKTYTPSPSRFRHEIIFKDNNICGSLQLSPNDAHYLKDVGCNFANEGGVIFFNLGNEKYRVISQSNSMIVLQRSVVCTDEAKTCPDGSSVGRTGPDCEFVCAEVGTNKKQEGFNFIFKYGVDAKNVLDTFAKTYEKDMVEEKSVTINFELSQSELQSIYQKIIELDLFNKTPVENSDMQVTPCSSYYLKTEINSIQKEINWNNCNGVIKDEFNIFSDYVIKIIELKKEYQKLPPAKGGYI